jgi:hypothetical protein
MHSHQATAAPATSDVVVMTEIGARMAPLEWPASHPGRGDCHSPSRANTKGINWDGRSEEPPSAGRAGAQKYRGATREPSPCRFPRGY